MLGILCFLLFVVAVLLNVLDVYMVLCFSAAYVDGVVRLTHPPGINQSRLICTAQNHEKLFAFEGFTICTYTF